MKTFVIKLGGSMLSKSDEVMFDFEYVRNLGKALSEFSQEDYRFFIITGGGYLMRKYRDMAKLSGVNKTDDLHWIGTTVNVLHAEMARATLSDISNERIFAYEDYFEKEIEFEKKLIFGGGARAGCSGDYDALIVANRIDAEAIISLKNIDGVYTADPKIEPTAKRLESISWDEYFKIINFQEVHLPGGNFPIDPVTSKQANIDKKKFIIIAGDDLDNLKNLLANKKYIGTIVG